MLKYHLVTSKAALGHNAVPLLASAAIVALALAVATPARAQSDLGNEWDVPSKDPATNTFGPTGMEFDYLGDATGCIPPQDPNDWLTNPWYAYTVYLNVAPSGPIHIAYDANANLTRVTEPINGLPLPVPALAPNSGFKGPTDGNGATSSYHVGLVNSFLSACKNNPIVKKRWIWAGASYPNNIQYQDIPVAATNWVTGEQEKLNWKKGRAAVIYLETVNTQGVSTSGTWSYESYIPPDDGTPVTFLISNYSGYSITFANDNGIVAGLPLPKDSKCQKTPKCVENQQILDTLNNQYFPVYGQQGSPFTALPQLSGYTLAPGQSITIQAP